MHPGGPTKPRLPRPPRGDRRRGAALPFTLLLLIALALLSGAGFLLAFLDLRTAENQASSVRAFYVAEAALNRHLAERTADTSDLVQTTYDIDGNLASVVSSRLLRLDGFRQLRLVRAEGVYDPLREGSARRTLARVVLTPVPLRPAAALLSRGEIVLGPLGRVSGLATSGTCGTAPSSVAGLAVPADGFRGDTAALHGVPPLLATADIDSLALRSGLDWANVRRPEYIRPEIIVTDSWPIQVPPGPGEWPVVYAGAGAPPITSTLEGTGVLVVDGDLVVPGSLRWEGVAVIGGDLTVSGSLDIRGSGYVGLSKSVGFTDSFDLGGHVSIRYDACAVAMAAARLAGGRVSRPGSWFEVF